jgi:MoCo/4Fe-4S cofactor protein with predicted Tat translocation signal
METKNSSSKNEPQNEIVTSDYWRSLDEKYKTPEFLKTFENEFMSSPLKEEEGKDGMARRQFMKLMGASMALTAASCVRRPVQKIIPYNTRPGDVIIDEPNYYASSFFDGNQGLGLVVKAREGRPIFVAGSPLHPLNGQAISARASAHVLSLYDPDRLRNPVANSVFPKDRRNSVSVKRNWDQVDAKVVAQLKKGGVAVLTSSCPSPHTQTLLASFCGKFSGKKVTWDNFSTENIRKGQKISYGTAIVPNYRFEKAKSIVSIDGDFLGTLISPAVYTKRFTESRKPSDMSRLVSFHSVPTLTSLNADDSYPVKASQQLGVALSLLERVLAKRGGSVPSDLKKFALNEEQLGIAPGTLDNVAAHLLKHAGAGIVITGGMATDHENGLNLQLVVNWLNSALGNEGNTILAQGAVNGLEGSMDDLRDLIVDMEAGKVKTLIIHNLNPIYSFPANLKFAEALNKVEMVVSTASWMDETAKLADIVAPAGHSMENWNEYEFTDGLYSIQQPTIRPMYETRSFEESMMAWSKAAGSPIASEETFADVIKNARTKALGSDEEWFKYLQAGFHGKDITSGSARSLSSAAASNIKPVAPKEGLELSLFSTVHMTDGSMANTSWLLELGDPVSKVSWDNYLAVSPARAKEWQVKENDIVLVQVADQKLSLPVYIQPSMHKDQVAVAVGYGRTSGGELLKGVGFNAFPLAQPSKDGILYAAITASGKKTGETYELAISQGHHTMEGRQIVAETTVKNFEKGDNGIHRHKVFSIWSGHKYDKNKWAMSVDLNTCTGCSACVIACQSENNVPVVGKKYVIQGREMHWLRIDRYYKGDEANPDAVFQPVMCQHCENAPCETVCPVMATVHSDEGLNDMVYNRCVGTRYCSNNCPYKVRRFNWFYFDSHFKRDPLQMALNPEVTVRTRGVMEKCTFCVQRIKDGKNVARDEERPLKDGDITPACAEVCPTGGIVFGDLNDPESRVAKLFQDQRQYTLLEEVNAAPRVRYLAKLRNTDRDMGNGHHEGMHAPAPNHNKEEHI